ncbi:MAG: GNAT family N-acetyltransferase [Propionibacteriales bacterium]|nr:GNAT family N-acetyltransferase [Propionibacteriales bacterium]
MTTLTLPVSTGRLLIRAYRPGDRAALLAIRSVPEVSRYLYTDPMDESTVDEALKRRMEIPAFDGDHQVLGLAGELRDTGELVADLTIFYHSHTAQQGEIGFILHPNHQGRGLAGEAAVELLRICFEDLGLHRVAGRCDGRNAASAGLMRRIGMRQEAHLRENEIVNGDWTDELVFALLSREWPPARTTS